MLAIWESFSIKQCYFAFPANVPPFRLSETSASKMLKLNCIEKQCIEKQTHYSADKGPYSQGYGLPSGHIWLWELDCKEGRAPNNWCLQTVVLEKTPESPLDSKEMKLVSLKRNQPWILVGSTDAEVETGVFWSSDANSQLNGKVSWCWERLRAEREWDGWMASPMKRTWTWTNFGRWWETERPGML